MRSARLIKFIALFSIIIGIFLVLVPFLPVIKDEIWYSLKSSDDEQFSAFAGLIFSKPLTTTPVNKDFALVIDKIGVNVPVIPDVYVSDENVYKEALKQGVAHAARSEYPSENPGNVYLFAHASVNFWELGKYATVFNLLRKLEIGDTIHLLYKGDTYVYTVTNKEVVKGWNTNPLIRPVIEPILTLQTCDPPGTTLNRLVVTAKLLEVQ